MSLVNHLTKASIRALAIQNYTSAVLVFNKKERLVLRIRLSELLPLLS